MTVTYEQAREIVRERFEHGWPFGTFCLDDRKIVENDDFYVFSIGAREFIIDGNWSYMIAGGGTPIVYKSDGHVDSRQGRDLATDPSIRRRTNPNPTLTVLRARAPAEFCRLPPLAGGNGVFFSDTTSATATNSGGCAWTVPWTRRHGIPSLQLPGRWRHPRCRERKYPTASRS